MNICKGRQFVVPIFYIKCLYKLLLPGLLISAAIRPKKIAAAIPVAVAVRPPLKAPKFP